MNPTYFELVLAAYYSALTIAFLCANRQWRAVLVIIALFTYGLSSDIGLTLDPTKVLALGAWPLILLGRIRIDRSVAVTLARRWLPFATWTTAVCIVGINFVPTLAFDSWARSPEGKPIIQLFSNAIFVSYAGVFIDALRTTRDVKFVLRAWLRIAICSAALCYIQVSAYFLTGQSAWGIFRGPDLNDFAGLSIFGQTIQRASAVGGEPKQEALELMVTIAMVIGARRSGLLGLRRWKFPAVCLFLLGALVLTFSSGAFLVLVLFGVYLLTQRARNAGRRIAVTSAAIFALGGMIFPRAFVELYDERLARIWDKVELLQQGDAADDRELPAMIYLTQHSRLAITGVGLGAGPFYYESLIRQPRFQGLYIDPDGGITWALYSFGIIGMILALAAVVPTLIARGITPDRRIIVSHVCVCVLLFFVPLHPLPWLIMVVGIGMSQGLQGRPLAARPRLSRLEHPVQPLVAPVS